MGGGRARWRAWGEGRDLALHGVRVERPAGPVPPHHLPPHGVGPRRVREAEVHPNDVPLPQRRGQAGEGAAGALVERFARAVSEAVAERVVAAGGSPGKGARR